MKAKNRAGESGKAVTSKDVARIAGVSQSTVSMILNNYQHVSFSEETRRRVFEACISAGYRGVSPKPVAENEKMLLTVCPSSENLDYSRAVATIQQRCLDLGYCNFTLYTFRDPDIENSILHYLKVQPFAGVIFLYQPKNIWHLSQIENIKPTVSVCDRNPNVELDAIELNSNKVGKIIAHHLIELGHERIAYIAIDLSDKYMTRIKRLEGLKEGYRENEYDPEECIRICTYEREALSANKFLTEYEAGFVLANRAVEKYDITALVGNNDMICLGILEALKRKKLRIPQDYSVCGCDNIALSNLKAISLTTIEHYSHLRAREAVDVLIKKIRAAKNGESGDESPVSITRVEYEPKIIVRASTGPARR